MEEYINLFEKIIEKTITQVDYIDDRAGMSDNTSILMKDGKVDEINTGMSLGARIRVLKNGAWGFAYTTDLSKLNEITDTAIQLSNSLTGDVELSESEIIKDVTGENPVALLDDVMSELDEKRQDYVLNHIKERQVFLTCCDPSQVLRLCKGKSFLIESGKIKEEK